MDAYMNISVQKSGEMDRVCLTEWERERFNEYIQVGVSIATHLLVLSLSGSLWLSLSLPPPV